MGSAIRQGELWGAAARDWADLQEPLHLPLWEAMLDAVKVGRNTNLFDAGCGGGGASLLAAQRQACVSGLDASEALITIARERIPQGDFRVGDLEDLPYDSKTFDVIIASNSVQYAADPVLALQKLRRVCVFQGRMVISTWGLPDYCDQRVVFKAVRDAQPPTPNGSGPFALSAAGALESLVEQAGWEVVGSGEVDCPYEYIDLESHWKAQRSGGPLQAAIRSVGEARIRAAVDRAVEPYRTSIGRVRLENRFRFVTATI